ncbi:MAG TPA: hypothetical protein VLE50_03055 [Cellvibrio sp.]|nr:hypothetical protein [Cellvibrio sp.]
MSIDYPGTPFSKPSYHAACYYFGALFPQFIAPDRPLVPQFALLTVIFLLMDLVWMPA